jgi:hypothetical protein
MRSIKFAAILFAMLLTQQAYAQITSSDFTGVTWKVSEYYLNNIRHQNATIDSLRYHFKSNGILELRPSQNVVLTLNYVFNATNAVITVSDNNSIEGLYTVVFADSNNLVWTSSHTNASGVLEKSEFRMIPDPD